MKSEYSEKKRLPSVAASAIANPIHSSVPAKVSRRPTRARRAPCEKSAAKASSATSTTRTWRKTARVAKAVETASVRSWLFIVGSSSLIRADGPA